MRVLTGFAGLMAVVYASIAGAEAPAAAPKPDLARGQQLATTVCAACHNADGNSVVPTNPRLASQNMQGMAAGLTPEDMQAVGAYFAMQKPADNFAHDKALAQRGQEIWRGGIKSQG